MGGLGFGGWAHVVGANAYTPQQAEPWTGSVCGMLGGGGCVNVTKPHGTDHERYGGDMGVGLGGFAELIITPFSLNMGQRDSYLFGLHWNMRKLLGLS